MAGAAPLPAATVSFDQTCDHELVDLLWFYGCVATVPSAFCNADSNLIACGQDIEDFDSSLQQPASRESQRFNTASMQFLHQSPRKNRKSTCGSVRVDIIKEASLDTADKAILLWQRDIIRGEAATISAEVNNATVISTQQCGLLPSASCPASANWLRRVFNKFDENKDGMLSMEELRRSLEKLGIETSNESIDSLLSHSPSKDQKGLVSQDDFLFLYQGDLCTHDDVEHIDCKIMNEDAADEELLWDAFNVFDKDRDGFISPVELQSVLCSLGFGVAQELNECTEMIKRYDQDGDGQVNFEEFKAMLYLAIRHT